MRGDRRDREMGGGCGRRGRHSVQTQSQSLLPLYVSPHPTAQGPPPPPWRNQGKLNLSWHHSRDRAILGADINRFQRPGQSWWAGSGHLSVGVAKDQGRFLPWKGQWNLRPWAPPHPHPPAAHSTQHLTLVLVHPSIIPGLGAIGRLMWKNPLRLMKGLGDNGPSVLALPGLDTL